VHRLIAPRDQKHQSNFVEFRSLKIVYRRYAGLFFCVCVDANDNELSYLEAIHFFVEVLDQFFGNVCELDLVFNFYKVGGCLVVYCSGELASEAVRAGSGDTAEASVVGWLCENAVEISMESSCGKANSWYAGLRNPGRGVPGG
jgi:hypothetical protein